MCDCFEILEILDIRNYDKWNKHIMFQNVI